MIIPSQVRQHKVAGLYPLQLDPLGTPRCRFKNSGPQAPQAVDPNVAAAAQTRSNIDTANANRTNQVTPSGTSSWTQGPDGRWTQTQSYSPEINNLFQAYMRQAGIMQPAGDALAGQVGGATTKPLDFGGVNNDYISAGPTALNERATDAIYNKEKGFLDPQWSQQQTDLEDKLSRQGIPVGSEAYNRATTNFNNARTQAYDAARGTAVDKGMTGASNMFNMAMLGQNQNITQQQLAQQNPLRLLSMLYGGG